MVYVNYNERKERKVYINLRLIFKLAFRQLTWNQVVVVADL